MAVENHVFVVTGAAGGIGTALARRLASRGARLVLCSRRAAAAAALAEELGAEAFPGNPADPDSADAMIAHAVAKFGRLDGAVNCAGSLVLKPAHLTTPAEWAATIEANLTTAFLTVRSAAKAMMNSGGSIVLISSAAARTGIANHEAIAAAKAGVIGLTLSAAATYAPRGIRVNCVAPGLTATPLAARITSNEESAKASVRMHALGRLGSPGDIASAVEWLLDPEQSWVTGQVLGVDGGLGSVRPR